MFTDTVPLVLNALAVMVVGNITVHTTPSSACAGAPTLFAFVHGLVVASYVLPAILAAAALRHQVTAHIRWPFLLLLAWMGGAGAWSFVGLGAVAAAYGEGCAATAPALFVFALLQLLLIPLLAAAVLLKWFSSALLRTARATLACCCGKRACCRRGGGGE